MATNTATVDKDMIQLDRLAESIAVHFRGKNVDAKPFTDRVMFYARRIGLDQQGYSIPRIEMDAMVKHLASQKEMKHMHDPAVREQMAASLVTGFVEKASPSVRDATEARHNVKTSLEASLANYPLKQKNTFMNNYEAHSNSLSEQKDKCLGGGLGRTVIGLGALYGVVEFFKAAFRPKVKYDEQGNPVAKQKPGFWQTVGNLAVAGGIAYFGWQMAVNNKGLRQTAIDATKAPMSWVDKELLRRNQAAPAFGAPVQRS